MISLKEQIANKCIHFNGLQSKQCKKGIDYSDVQVKSSRPYKVPCLLHENMNGGECEHCEFPSNNEVKKQVDEICNYGAKTIKAYQAIKSHYEKTKEAKGKIECTECGGELHYTVASVNGHIWAKCSGCGMVWME